MTFTVDAVQRLLELAEQDGWNIDYSGDSFVVIDQNTGEQMEFTDSGELSVPSLHTESATIGVSTADTHRWGNNRELFSWELLDTIKQSDTAPRDTPFDESITIPNEIQKVKIEFLAGVDGFDTWDVNCQVNSNTDSSYAYTETNEGVLTELVEQTQWVLGEMKSGRILYGTVDIWSENSGFSQVAPPQISMSGAGRGAVLLNGHLDGQAEVDSIRFFGDQGQMKANVWGMRE